MVTTGPETTTSKVSTVQENTTATSSSLATAADHKLQICSCGWRKITSFRGLRIHQGKKRCLSEKSQGPRIDYFLQKESNQSNEVHQLDENHSLESISTPVMEEGNSLKRHMSGNTCGILSWLLTLDTVAGMLKSAQWKWGAEALWEHLPQNF
ncbi:hypothetical protein D5F01_LYC02281 [Larimichthys crocea]|uniref:Uncharacterized protein n=1 Tax=Larimichthys crocea TaxID=215358 RepID=A0A6G0J8J9_LARCR|nr:hypothetical protein D5F01_LYC02281 [Larimichthys crocea]